MLWAGLYWGADTSAGTNGAVAPSAAAKGTVKLQVPGGSYQAISATAGDVLTSSLQATRYRAFRDVTALVTTGGAGTYSVADVQSGTGQDRFAGWALIVAYRDNAQPIRRLNVYDGLGTVDAGHTFSTVIAPFHTPATGTVTTKAGLLSYEGDASLATETATFNGQPLTDALNPVEQRDELHDRGRRHALLGQDAGLRQPARDRPRHLRQRRARWPTTRARPRWPSARPTSTSCRRPSSSSPTRARPPAPAPARPSAPPPAAASRTTARR